MDKNVDDLWCHEETKQQECWQNTWQGATDLSHKPEARYLLIPQQVEMHFWFRSYGSVWWHNAIIARLLHLLLYKNKLHNEKSAHSVEAHTAECEIDNRSIYDNLDLICKEVDLYLYVKQHKSKIW